MSQFSKLQFIVPDMDCEGCISSITRAINRVDAHAGVAADLATKHVIVTSGLEANAVASAIQDAGFTIKSA